MADGNPILELRRRSAFEARTLNLALQGDGAHGPFAWGVLDRLLEDPRVEIEGVSATGAGAVNAVVLAYGFAIAGRNGGRAALTNFWRRISHSGLEPLGVRAVLGAEVAFERLRGGDVRLELGAVEARSGRLRIFEAPEIGIDHVMAAASQPEISPAVEIDGQRFAAYRGSAARFPFLVRSRSREVVLVREAPPRPADELPCGEALAAEMRALAEVSRRIDRGVATPEALRRPKVHRIDSHGFPAGSRPAWGLMTALRDLGRAQAAAWLAVGFDVLGRGTIVRHPSDNPSLRAVHA